jgi:hypothetical protein
MIRLLLVVPAGPEPSHDLSLLSLWTHRCVIMRVSRLYWHGLDADAQEYHLFKDAEILAKINE